MHVRKIALGVSGLALALPMAAAVPAQAAVERHRGDVRILDIGDVELDRRDAEIEIRIGCNSRDDGRLRVTVWQDDARYSGRERVECDGHDRVTVELDRDDDGDRLEEGRAWVRAVLRVDRERDREEDRVRVNEDDDRHHR